MRSSEVYRSTTTPYDRSKAWVPSFLAQADSSSVWSKISIYVLGILFAVMGLIMIIVGASSLKTTSDSDTQCCNSPVYISILCVGVVLELAAIAVFILCRRLGYYIPCCPSKIARIRKHLHDSRFVSKFPHGKGGEPVSAQYCPPAPPAGSSPPSQMFADVSEQQRLMSEKQLEDELGDDTERILDEDPRIVLTPLKNHEEC